MINYNESILETYYRELCKYCKNKEKNICEIKEIKSKIFKCKNYERQG